MVSSNKSDKKNFNKSLDDFSSDEIKNISNKESQLLNSTSAKDNSVENILPEFMIKSLKPRLYQELIFANSIGKNSMVVLPTGLGKTIIAMLFMKYYLEKKPSRKILFLAPTKPLCMQHEKSINDFFSNSTFLSTGSITPKKRKEEYEKAQIIISTPQTIENDLISSSLKPKDFSLVIFDEAHRATGNYAYVTISKIFKMKSRLTKKLALSASPGTSYETVKEISKNLNINHVEFRTESDPDVRRYLMDKNVKYLEIDLPDSFKTIIKSVNDFLKRIIKKLKSIGYLTTVAPSSVTKTKILSLQRAIFAEMQKNRSKESFQAVSLCAQYIKVDYAKELIESQGINPFVSYLEKIWVDSESSKTKALKAIASDEDMKKAFFLAKSLYTKKVQHPKMDVIRKLVKKILSSSDGKMIIFNQYRDSLKNILEEISEIKGAKPVGFVGQSSRSQKGLSQKEQKKIIEDFRSGEYNILVATSVAEEGLDIPSVDNIIFYEPVPSAIRQIQRRGRTGRHSEGNVFILVSKGTKDVAYKYSTKRKEANMWTVLSKLKKEMESQTTLDEEVSSVLYEDINVIVDSREKNGSITKLLSSFIEDIELKNLEIGDYQVSDEVCIERKSVEDFVNSLIDGRLFEQLKKLKSYKKPILLVEGKQDIYSIRKIHPNALRGLISSVILDFQIPIVYTQDEEDTVNYIVQIAKREQKQKRKFTIKSWKVAKTLDEELINVMVAFPSLGENTARKILSHFGTLKKFSNTSLEELQKIEGIGKKLSQTLIKVLNHELGK